MPQAYSIFSTPISALGAPWDNGSKQDQKPCSSPHPAPFEEPIPEAGQKSSHILSVSCDAFPDTIIWLTKFRSTTGDKAGAQPGGGKDAFMQVNHA